MINLIGVELRSRSGVVHVLKKVGVVESLEVDEVPIVRDQFQPCRDLWGCVAQNIRADVQRNGGHVFYTQDWHPPETPHFADFGGVWPIHCVRDTWGAELRTDIEVAGPVVRKGANGEDGYSGFTMRDPETGSEQPTELNALLKAKAITEVVVVGLALDVCVKATALDAIAYGYATTVLTAQSRAVNLSAGDGEAALAEMRAAAIAIR